MDSLESQLRDSVFNLEPLTFRKKNVFAVVITVVAVLASNKTPRVVEMASGFRDSVIRHMVL